MVAKFQSCPLITDDVAFRDDIHLSRLLGGADELPQEYEQNKKDWTGGGVD